MSEDVFAADAEAVDTLAQPSSERTFSWLGLAGAAALGLIGMAFGLWIESLLARLFGIAPWAGLVGIALTALLVLGVLVIVVREIVAIRRLGSQAELREEAKRALAMNDDRLASAVIARLGTLLGDRPKTARGRAELGAATTAIMDAGDRLALAERVLLDPLDRDARALVLAAAQRVSIVTAVAPRALIDVAFVLFETARLVRRVAAVYGLRPGRLGFVRLLRNVLAHLAVTGTIAVGDSIFGEALGHGVASKVSSRFGEGIVNGLLTARVGIATMDLCRPLPFQALPRPTIALMAKALVRRAPARERDEASPR